MPALADLPGSLPELAGAFPTPSGRVFLSQMDELMPSDRNIENDPQSLRSKYLAERDKRVRPEGDAQFISIEDEFASYEFDPYADPDFARDPIVEDIEVLLIGGGHAGLLGAYHLRQAGIDDFRIIEKAGDFGGTWYWNRYPNCRCDVESYIYLPLIEQFGEMPTEKYIRSSEILAHAQRVARNLELYDKAIFRTAVKELRWNEEIGRWIVSTDRGDTIRARFVAMGSGPLNRPKLPGIPGIETFKGRAFHTSRWDYGYTGGDEKGNLTGLADKRVAIIGTGATAVQAITALAQSCGHLYVVQRTPAAVDPRDNRPTDPAWWSSHRQPGWWENRARNFEGFFLGVPQQEDLVSDGWTTNWKRFADAAREAANAPSDSGISITQGVDFEKMGVIRARIDAIVKDPATAEALKPWYNWFCKRPLFHDGYYEVFNRPNVTLVDTRGKSLDRITENAIVFDGVEHEVDCIIYASGFEAAAPSNRSGGFDLIGKDGLTLEEHWSGGMRTLHGMLIHNFPNIATIHGIKQTVTSWNGSLILYKHTEHFVKLVQFCRDHGYRSFEATKEAEAGWLEELKAKSVADLQFLADCTPGYINNEGKNPEQAIYASMYGPGLFDFIDLIKQWRETGITRDLAFDPLS